MSLLAIIQARHGSTRLPAKVLADIAGKPLLEHVIDRVRRCRHVQGVVLATTRLPEDDALQTLAVRLDVPVTRGDEEDVLARFALAAREHGASTIVRITADDPFKDPQVIDRVIEAFLESGADYASNALEPSYPEGLDVEVISLEALLRADREATRPFEREHVTPYVWERPETFSLVNVRHEGPDLSRWRWTCDTAEDLAFARAVYDHLWRENATFTLAAILELLEQEPGLADLIPDIQRNAGLKKSREDS